MNSYSISQHDVMRQLALFLTERDDKDRLRRLYMPQKQSEFPPEWQTTQIVSIHKGAMDTQWPQLEFPELIVPSLHEDCRALKSLQKIYPSLCEGLGKDKLFNLPALLEFNVDHCSDLEELSAGICYSKSLEILSITHCHSLAKLPDDLGKLGSLKVIRLCQSPGLKALPLSICSLGNLELLNISSCMGLKVGRRKGSELKKTFQSLAQTASLKKVICDENNEQLFRNSTMTMTSLEVEVVKEEFNLNWLLTESQPCRKRKRENSENQE
ncbi:hypothetical protein SUGI_0902360 [Cryptomeria japonica]|nr:hypothetical protein SUGI_0902360 [Cryptomeria japonica]